VAVVPAQVRMMTLQSNCDQSIAVPMTNSLLVTLANTVAVSNHYHLPSIGMQTLTSLLFHGTSRGSYKVGKTVLESLLCHTYDQSIAVRMANVLSYVQHF
jgi:hypothetical protein